MLMLFSQLSTQKQKSKEHTQKFFVKKRESGYLIEKRQLTDEYSTRRATSV